VQKEHAVTERGIDRSILSASRVCVVLLSPFPQERDRIGEMVARGSGSLLSYERVEQLAWNEPVGRVAMVILATRETPESLGRVLSFVRRRWPRTTTVVVADEGSGDVERAARGRGALFFTRPVGGQLWLDMVQHTLQSTARPAAAGVRWSDEARR
jgi:hypothetical protein